MLALLVIPANALFLDAYGAKWLPATYIAIAVFGTGASALVARAARRTPPRPRRDGEPLGLRRPLRRVLADPRGGRRLGLGGSARPVPDRAPDGVRVHRRTGGPAARRAADEGAVSAHRGRVLGRVPPRRPARHPAPRPARARPSTCCSRRPSRSSRSSASCSRPSGDSRRCARLRPSPRRKRPAVGADAVRARASSCCSSSTRCCRRWARGSSTTSSSTARSAHYSGDDLTRFLSWYTAVLNLADILFLALLAGPLMRRFGLRLGLVLNPAVVAALLAVMAVVVAGPGAASFGLFALAGVVRIADIVLTDGTTRTSVNASFQVVPVGDRLAVQAVVEGIGVPVAIGATGVVLLLMNVVGLGIGAVIVFGVVLSVIWTVSGAAMYRSYTRALADEMRRRSLDASGARDRRGRRRAAGAAPVRRRARRSPRARPAARCRLAGGRGRPPRTRRSTRIPRSACGPSSSSPPAATRRPAAEAAALAGDLARSADPADRRAAAAALGVATRHDRGHARRAPRRRRPDGAGRGTRRRRGRGRRRPGGRPPRRRGARGAAHRGQRDRRAPTARRRGRPAPRRRAHPRRGGEAPGARPCGSRTRRPSTASP